MYILVRTLPIPSGIRNMRKWSLFHTWTTKAWTSLQLLLSIYSSVYMDSISGQLIHWSVCANVQDELGFCCLHIYIHLHFMWIACIVNDSHEMSYFLGNSWMSSMAVVVLSGIFKVFNTCKLYYLVTNSDALFHVEWMFQDFWNALGVIL